MLFFYKPHCHVTVTDTLLILTSSLTPCQLDRYDLGLSLFVSEVLTKAPIDSRILEGALALIDGSRSGDTVNRQQLRELTSALTEAGAVTPDAGTHGVFSPLVEPRLQRHETPGFMLESRVAHSCSLALLVVR
jgi:hypothetical protein